MGKMVGVRWWAFVVVFIDRVLGRRAVWGCGRVGWDCGRVGWVGLGRLGLCLDLDCDFCILGLGLGLWRSAVVCCIFVFRCGKR